MDKGSCHRWQINVSVGSAFGINLPHRAGPTIDWVFTGVDLNDVEEVAT
jgi:hypothetical protein